MMFIIIIINNCRIKVSEDETVAYNIQDKHGKALRVRIQVITKHNI